MKTKPIKTERDYTSALARVEEIWGTKKGTLQGDELDLLATLVEGWEMKNYPIKYQQYSS